MNVRESRLWRGLVRWFLVPSDPPTLPAAPTDVCSFQPDPGFLGYLKAALLIVAALVVVPIAIVAIVLFVVEWWVGLLVLPVLLVVVAIFGVAWVALHLRYETTWYVMTPRSLRLRRGIWVIREMTVTFENVQNVKVTQGPLERVFGIASLVVETAGGGGGKAGASGGDAHAAVIEGVRNANELRDRIFERLRRSRSTGLGDDDAHAGTAAWTPAHVEVLREIAALLSPAS